MLSSEGAICGLAAPSQSVEFQPNETHDPDRVLPTVKWGQGIRYEIERNEPARAD